MKMIWIGWTLGVLIAACVVIYLIGAALPTDHIATGEALIPAPIDRVAARVRDVERQPDWRSGVTAIVDTVRDDEAVRYVEVAGSDRTAYPLREDVPDRRFISTIADPSLPYGGTWTISLTPQGNATSVRVEERGTVRSPLFRFVSTVILGHERTLRTWLYDLARAEAQPNG